jgi:hypothetical protein
MKLIKTRMGYIKINFIGFSGEGLRSSAIFIIFHFIYFKIGSAQIGNKKLQNIDCLKYIVKKLQIALKNIKIHQELEIRD